MNNRIRAATVMFIAAAAMLSFVSCKKAEKEPVELTILAAASLTDVCGELESVYAKKEPDIRLVFSFGGSGALQTQIEEGASADIFISASAKQMDALKEEGLMIDDSIEELLENRLVLVVPKDSDKDITCFEDAAGEEVEMIGLGDPGSVPAGQYAEEVFASLGILDQVKQKANYGSDVRTVLAWVESGEADCGVVYATDAYSSERVRTAAEAPVGLYSRIIYPAGIVGASAHQEEAEEFMEFLKSDEAEKVFESYGF